MFSTNISDGCFVSQRYWKMKAIHNPATAGAGAPKVVLYPKDTEKWKQFTTTFRTKNYLCKLFCIPKILKNESNSQHKKTCRKWAGCCFVSQRYWKMKAIHNYRQNNNNRWFVVLYPKDTEKWKQFTTTGIVVEEYLRLFCIPKILKNESNSQHNSDVKTIKKCCFVSQRYWKMKAIHNNYKINSHHFLVVLYPKDTEKWKQFTTTMQLVF